MNNSWNNWSSSSGRIGELGDAGESSEEGPVSGGEFLVVPLVDLQVAGDAYDLWSEFDERSLDTHIDRVSIQQLKE